MGIESQTEQLVYDLGNDTKNKQHHDVQKGLEGQQNH